ncbi:hypothetical protein BCR36DRAFT_582998 [Piromyces finnis]|uniref:Uncharacterized protein n=1 Tax=Piromyces finnis TaxID=1754191 RepID=A0A1Y1VAS3_9FUNG|nr:hypothetical protein BCR36DRAFT_582998 [Piromyces finnis]|eukprot:ORX51454.1 hypothetical protein BCR36DRAFT_582998 [Piromyces finnis]
MAANNYEELTKKCQEIFEKIILENKDEIEQLNKNDVKKHSRTLSMAPPNSYGLYGSSRRQCDIECTIIRPRSNSVPASFLSEYNTKHTKTMGNINSSLVEPTVEPIQEEGEFEINERPKFNESTSTDPILNAKLRKLSSKVDHSRSRSLSSISETEVLTVENIENIDQLIEEEKEEEKEEKEMKPITRNRSYSYCYGNAYLKAPLSIDEYKKRVELEVYRQQIKCYEKLEYDNLERSKYQKFLKWQEIDYQNKRSSWNI